MDFAQSWTALFRAFSSHWQPSASLTKLFPSWTRLLAEPVAGPENFGGGGFGAKTLKIRMSSPKLRLIFRPKSEIQTFFSPKIRWSPKKKKKRS